MALRHIARRRAPIDATWFRTEARLNGILRAKTGYDDNVDWPKFIDDTIVPLFVRMQKYKAEETKQNPDGMIFGPVVRIGSMESTKIEMFGHHHQSGLFKDYCLDPYYDTREDQWMYLVINGDTDAPGEDVSAYECPKCSQWLYKDEKGVRENKSACMFKGEIVCRDCDVTGLVHAQEAFDQIERCRNLTAYLDHRFDRKTMQPDSFCRNFEQRIAYLSYDHCWGRPCQTRIFKEDQFSFHWNTTVFEDDGKKRRGIHGGLIQHGPTPVIGEDGKYSFLVYDYAEKKKREATTEEVGNINWSIHT